MNSFGTLFGTLFGNHPLEIGTNVLLISFAVAVIVARVRIALRDLEFRRRQRDIARAGVEMDAEILARLIAEAPEGSEVARARVPWVTSWDLRQLDLRYRLGEREIRSRGRVSVDVFDRTRDARSLRIKVSPERPEEWAAA